MLKDPIDIHVGQRLRHFRHDRGESLETVAKAIGVTYQQLQKYENASNRVSASQLWRLVSYLKADVDSFFPNAGHPTTDLDLIDRLERLPPNIRSMIGGLAEAIVASERQASGLSDPPVSDPT